jgi:hypothetical protein
VKDKHKGRFLAMDIFQQMFEFFFTDLEEFSFRELQNTFCHILKETLERYVHLVDEVLGIHGGISLCLAAIAAVEAVIGPSYRAACKGLEAL